MEREKKCHLGKAQYTLKTRVQVSQERVVQSLFNPVEHCEYYKSYSVDFTLRMRSCGWQETVELPGSEVHGELQK